MGYGDSFGKRHAHPALGLAIGAAVLAVAFVAASMDLEDASVPCGTALSPRQAIDSPQVGFGSPDPMLGSTSGCDGAVKQRRVMILGISMLGLAVAGVVAMGAESTMPGP